MVENEKKEPLKITLDGETIEPKPKTKRKRKKKTDNGSEQLTIFITTIFTVISSREGCEHWAISDAEARSIAEPLCKLMEESESLKAINEHSDAIALVFACITVILPRVFISYNLNKDKKQKKVKKEVKSDERTITESNKPSNEQFTNTHRNDGIGLSWLGGEIG